MSGFSSLVRRDAPEFSENRAAMLSLVAQLRALESRAAALSEQRRPRFEERGQLTPRERVARLLDPGMPFLALHTLANYLAEDRNPDTSVPGASLIAGIGFVSGVRSLVWADDSGIKAGALAAMTLPTVLSIQKIALRQKLPLIHLVESAGANLMEYRVEDWAQGGGVFYSLARLSSAGIPTVTVLNGPSTAGGAYMPGMSDYVIGVKKNGMAALAGAALVHAATGEVADEEQLGGAQMHATVSGLVEYLAEDDADGIAIARRVISGLDWNKGLPVLPERRFDAPRHPADELAGAVPVDPTRAYDMREIACRIVDGSRFEEFKPGYGASTVCMHASIFGISCGIVGNNGPIDPQGAQKAAQFLQSCDQAGLPVIFLNNTTGYLVGTQYEQAGMIKHGSKMIQAVSNISVPKITLYVGASFGAGNYGMAGHAFEPDFLFAWPNAVTGVMGGNQAAKTMGMVLSGAARRRGEAIDAAMLAGQEAKIAAHFDRQSGAFYTSGRVLDHGVIDPRDTRLVLGFALETCLEARARRTRPNSFGVARM
jgi:geranyl-CoA carboxylase beta subunit